jgi:hypothetical protein
MFMKFKIAGNIVMLLLACSAMSLVTMSAAAHHSFAMFDFDKTIACPATVKEFRWTNPHVTLLIEATPKPGEPVETWSLELTSPGNLTRIGWTHSSFKPGDLIDVKFNPLRDGKHGGAFLEAKIQSSGQVFKSSVRDANDTPNLQ